MKRRVQIAACIVFAVFLFAAAPMRSEGPLYVGGPQLPPAPPTSTGTVDGAPYAWSITSNAFDSTTKTLSYWTDPGTLGSMTSAEADTFVQSALDAWAAVPTANINFTLGGHLGADVTSSNYLSVENAVYNCATLPNPPSGGIAGPVTIIFDSDGGIIRSLGEDPSSILGFADGLCLSSNGINNTYNRGFSLINGSAGVTNAELKTVMIHEFGHMLGLDHTQINLDCLTHLQACKDDGSIAGVPIMFPVLVDDKTAITNQDDIAGISTLYPVTVVPSPNPNNKALFSALGEIHGRVFFSDGVTQAQGFNVIARSVANPRIVAVSNMSGFLFTEEVTNGAIPYSSNYADPFFSQNQSVIGYFDIPGLPPGDYTVEVEAINNSGLYPFVGGSSIGPIGSWLGYQFALPGTCKPQQFYVSPAGADPCVRTNATPVTVQAVSATGPVEVDISFTGTPQRFDAWED